MIVRCEKIYNPNTKEFIESNSNNYLTKGREYIVLEIEYLKKEVLYRLITDDCGQYGTPVLKRSDEFSIISGKIPPNWVLRRFTENCSTLGPEKWLNPDYWKEDFWDDWCSGETKAQECFEEEYKIMREADNLERDDRFRRGWSL